MASWAVYSNVHDGVRLKPTEQEMETPAPLKELGSKQELRLITHLDEAFLTLSRSFESRHAPRATLPTLQSFLNALRPLSSLILSIPPVGASATLRVAFYLQLISQLPGALASYALTPLPLLWSTLRMYDHFTLIILRGLPYNSKTQQAGSPITSHDQGDSGVRGTDRVRLLSIVQDIRETLKLALGVSFGNKVNIAGEVTEPAFQLPTATKPLGDDSRMESMSVETPSLATDSGAEATDSSVIDFEEDEGEDDEDDDFDEVDVASPGGRDDEELFSIHFAAPPVPMATQEQGEAPLTEGPRLGFDPDAEYADVSETDGEGDADMRDVGDEDLSVAVEVEKVFKETLAMLQESSASGDAVLTLA